MTPTITNEAELYLERGGPTYRLMQRIGLIRGEDPSIMRRIIGFIAITWLPLFILSLFEGQALGPSLRKAFLMDFATYARFFVAVPILFIAEVVIGPRLRTAGLQFVRGGFVRQEDYPAFADAVARLARRRESVWAELIIWGLALVWAWTMTAENWLGGSAAATWRSIGSEGNLRPSLAGLWYFLVSVPILEAFLMRWLWRIIIWTCFLRDMSRLNLDLVPTHADEAGGLSFLGGAHLSFGILAFGFGSVLSAVTASNIIFDGAQIIAFKGPSS